MALRMIIFYCPACEIEFEELVDATDGVAELDSCPRCSEKPRMVMDFCKRVHRQGNRYRDVSWSSWSVS